MLLSVLYISYMKKEYDKEELDELMSKFYLNNLKYDISGLLLYSERNVIQYIEGEGDNIEKLYDNIKNDTRHKNVFLLHKKEIQQRLFTEWKANVNYIEYNKFREEMLSGNKSRYENLAKFAGKIINVKPNDKILRFFLIAFFLCKAKKLSSAFKIIKPLSFVLLIATNARSEG